MSLAVHERVEIPPHCVKVPNGKNIYIHYTLRAYRNEKGQPTNERVSIGKLDPETGKAVFRKAEDTPFGFRGEVERLHLVFSPEDVKRVSPDRDLPGETRESVLPGPFEKY